MKNEIKLIKHLLDITKEDLSDLESDVNYKNKLKTDDNFCDEILVIHDRISYLSRVLKNLENGEYPKY